MYDHEKQYRCTIIRGKSQKEMDDLLPAYALVINEICPCKSSEFESKFNSSFMRFLPESLRKKKTLDNHRTEIAGKLFGMYYRSDDGFVYESQRTAKYLEDNDQPAFFKDICFKMQFPNGMDSYHTLQQRVISEIESRPNAFVLKLLKDAKALKTVITVKDIGYYVLNSLDVLQGKATSNEVLETIIKDHKAGISREIKAFDKDGNRKASSYTTQHIREQLNYLELANLIRITPNKEIVLNPNEAETIDLFIKDYNEAPVFNVYDYDIEQLEERNKFQLDWDYYFSTLSEVSDKFSTSSKAIEFEPEETIKSKSSKTVSNLVEFGDEGEAIVFEYEKTRVSLFNSRLTNKVLALGKTRGLGYDIQSVIAEPGNESEFVKYIEVKSTKRLTCPDLNDTLWVDTLNITRNEYIAAQQHKKYYSIYRVFFTRDGVSIFVIENVAEKINDGRIQAIPTTYRVDYSSNSVDNMIPLKGEGINV